MHIVAVLALHDVVSFDLAIPCEVFARVEVSKGAEPYEVRVCGETRTLRGRAFEVRPPFGLEALADADTIIVPGIENAAQANPVRTLTALQKAHASGVRIASICSGAFILAKAGLLDGRRATTHWIAADALAAMYPKVVVDPDVLFLDEGDIVTSAGASAGIDMCLHLIERDHGQAVAAHAARQAVAPLGRDGGQKQFILRDGARTVASGSIAETLEWIERRVAEPVTVADMATHAGMSLRTFARRFGQETGTTPAQWLISARLRQARILLETTKLNVDEVAARSGFGDAAGLRERFRQSLGVSPKRYRASFAAPRASSSQPRTR